MIAPTIASQVERATLEALWYSFCSSSSCMPISWSVRSFYSSPPLPGVTRRAAFSGLSLSPSSIALHNSPIHRWRSFLVLAMSVIDFESVSSCISRLHSLLGEDVLSEKLLLILSLGRLRSLILYADLSEVKAITSASCRSCPVSMPKSRVSKSTA